MLGLFIGFIIGYIIEDKFIKFNTIYEYKKEVNFSSKTCNRKDYIVKSVYRFLLGIFTLLLVFLILNYIMPKHLIFKFIKYLIISDVLYLLYYKRFLLLSFISLHRYINYIYNTTNKSISQSKIVLCDS